VEQELHHLDGGFDERTHVLDFHFTLSPTVFVYFLPLVMRRVCAWIRGHGRVGRASR
jgi:hypothetical protein